MAETMACHECEASIQGAARWLVLSEQESSRGEEVGQAGGALPIIKKSLEFTPSELGAMAGCGAGE